MSQNRDSAATGLRIRLIGPAPSARGGIAEFNTELTQVLRAAEADARVVAYRRTYPRFSRAGRQGVDPSSNRAAVPASTVIVPWLPWTWISAARALRRDRPDVVVIQWWHPILAGSSWYLAGRARAIGARVVFICHNALPHEDFPLARSLTRAALRRGTSLIALSDGVANELRALMPERPVQVVDHPPYSSLGVDERLEDRIRAWKSRVAADGRPSVLFFGNIRPYKGLMDLMDAFALVRREVDAMLIVAGTFFEPLDAYRRRSTELGVDDAVRFIPEYIPNEDVGALFALCDLVVLPYRTASQSGVVPLAAMHRKPVVATDVGGLPAALAGTGHVVPPRDPQALAAAIVTSLRTPPLPPPENGSSWAEWCNALGPADDLRGWPKG